MDSQEIALRQSLEIVNATIRDLCLRRDQIAASLPNAPRPKRMTHICGLEIKQGGGVKRRKQA